ncbi:hypothetical protein PPYR_10527 [Photinus pyralis]|uniref:Uncharacterized protein n=1 Tax=Photinus pyralis TaxID=7054 RepID=A0A5N4AGR0_PHOPY|nr:hypothetical protein PPYR_10527 [Photinus pyralis]
MEDANFYQTLSPLQRFSKFVGFLVWTMSKGCPNLNDWRIVWFNYVLKFLILILCLTHYQCCPQEFDTVERINFAILSYCAYVSVLQFLFVSTRHNQQLSFMVGNVVKIDADIKRLTGMSANYKVPRKRLIATMAMLYALNIAGLLQDIALAYTHNMFGDIKAACSFIVYGSALLSTSITCFAIFFLMELRRRLEIVHKYLKVKRYISRNSIKMALEINSEI